jgi:hypothetical protein
MTQSQYRQIAIEDMQQSKDTADPGHLGKEEEMFPMSKEDTWIYQAKSLHAEYKSAIYRSNLSDTLASWDRLCAHLETTP